MLVVPCRGKRSSVAMIACVRCLLLWKLRWLRFRVVVCEMLTSLMPSSLKAFRRSASSRIGMGSRMRFFTMVAADYTRHTPGCRAGDRQVGHREQNFPPQNNSAFQKIEHLPQHIAHNSTTAYKEGRARARTRELRTSCR